MVPSEACPSYAPSSAPISGSLVATTVMSTGPISSLPPTVSLSPTVSLGSDNPAVNDASTPDTIFVCGVDYTDASENFCTLPSCPTGDGCDDGAICFALPYAACEPVLGSMISVCGVDYADAAMNYCANPSSSPFPVTPMTSNSTTNPSTVVGVLDTTTSPAVSPLPTVASPSSSTSSAQTLSPSSSTSSAPTLVNTQFCGLLRSHRLPHRGWVPYRNELLLRHLVRGIVTPSYSCSHDRLGFDCRCGDDDNDGGGVQNVSGGKDGDDDDDNADDDDEDGRRR
ncbi:hypothetical protein ACHAW5_003069 [Stephanodiscus triporus]|uniref:Uncharacterized protein n=1 Tax=Stephanodiscus triporus TaxID=2934178 RepID=A0ABD3QGB9_9STRA